MTALEKQDQLKQKRDLMAQLVEERKQILLHGLNNVSDMGSLQRAIQNSAIPGISQKIKDLETEIPQLESTAVEEAKTLNPEDQDLFNKKKQIADMESNPNLSEADRFKLEGLKADVGYTEQGRKQQKAIQDFAGNYETKRQTQLANQQKQIADFLNSETATADLRRKSLAESLSSSNADIERNYGDLLAKTGQESFQQANPYILEDLNRRGLFTSPSEVANAQARALKEVALKNQGELGNLSTELATDTRNRLQNFDTNIYGTLEGLRQTGLQRDLSGQDLTAEQMYGLGESGLNARLQSSQDALNASLDSSRSLLNRQLNLADQDREERLANTLARRKRRADLTNSLINAGANILGASYGKLG